MDLLIKPSKSTLEKANKFIKVLDATNGSLMTGTTAFVSKTAKNIKTIKAPVIRFFEAPGTISTYFSEGEYDLVAMFKYLKYEAYFLKASQKKLSLLTKSGFAITADNDEVTEYFEKRFLTMQLATKNSLEYLVKMVSWYLIVCSNAFLIKVRDKNCPDATSYKRDGKDMHPVVGYFLAHPTTIKPRFKYIKEGGIWKWEIEKWIQTNRKGQLVEFNKEDVIHFTLYKEDGMILGMPDLVPAIDDIRTLRKIEEDIQLLIYRDLFPIIHYKVEKPQMIDHTSQTTELDQARRDMQLIVQDGGIATDARHEIEFVGAGGKSLDISVYLDYFKQRVWTGLGVSALDMSVADGGGGETQAQEASKTLMDTVKYIQQEISRQFFEEVLLELTLQSPYNTILTDKANTPKLVFQEIDIEWKIRQENHEADLFAKGTKTIHEVRNKRGDKTLSDEDLMYTHPALYGPQPPHKTLLDTPYGDKHAEQEGKVAHATTVETVTNTSQPGTPSKKTHTKPIIGSKGPSKSAATNDPIKTSKSNSNIVKKKATDSVEITDAQEMQDIKNRFSMSIEGLKSEHKYSNRLNIIFATKSIYDEIKGNMKERMYQGIEDACSDLGIDYDNVRVQHNIFSSIDSLRDNVSNEVAKDINYLNKAANRVAITNRTEQSRAYNYGYALMAVNNNKNKFVICSDSDNLSDDSFELLGSELDINLTNILDKIPPFKPNSRLKIRVKEEEISGNEE
jgi:hypothetical protein